MNGDFEFSTIGGIFATSDHDRFLAASRNASFDQFFPPALRDTTRNLYETGIDALAAILKERSEIDRDIRVWVTENFCRESLQRLSLKLDDRVRYRYYSHHHELKDLARSDYLIYLHFNCYRPDSAEIIQSLKGRSGATVIEDFVQAPLDISRFTGDYALNSLRKFSSLDVAVAYQHDRRPPVSTPTRYRILRKEAELAKSQFLRNPTRDGEQQVLSLGRASDEALLVRDISPVFRDEYERAIDFDFQQARQLRRQNYEYLARQIRSAAPEVTLLPGEYMYLMIETAHREHVRSRMYAHRIFPVIHWADSQTEQSKRILSFHIDQRYTPNDLERVAVVFASTRRQLFQSAQEHSD